MMTTEQRADDSSRKNGCRSCAAAVCDLGNPAMHGHYVERPKQPSNRSRSWWRRVRG